MTQALLKAAPHKWGEGKVHILNEDRSQTLCGKSIHHCPGEVVAAGETEPNCLVCNRAVESRERQRQWSATFESRQRDQEEERKQFWAKYNEYLDFSPEWQRRRTLVLARANGTCEGCGTFRATQVHHLTYERVFREMLFDLVAICESCHQALHPR